MKNSSLNGISVTSPEFAKLRERLMAIVPFPESEFVKLASKLQLETYKKRDLFLKRLEHPGRIAFVVSGLFRVCYMGSSDLPVVKTFCTEGKFLEPELASFKSFESEIVIEALEKSTVISIAISDAVELLRNSPEWLRLARTILEEQLSGRERREFQLLALDAFSRYELFLKEFPGLKERLSQNNIASYLGITPVSLNRLLRKNFPRTASGT